MAKLNRRSISRRTVEALAVEKDTVFWDRDLPGFGVRVYASGTKMYVVQSRAKGKSVRVTVGRHGVITADEARRRAARIVNRIKAGRNRLRSRCRLGLRAGRRWPISRRATWRSMSRCTARRRRRRGSRGCSTNTSCRSSAGFRCWRWSAIGWWRFTPG